MKIIVAGSRKIVKYEVVAEAIAKSGFEITELVQGEARGVDLLAKDWAIKNGVPWKGFKPDYNIPPAKMAPTRRNTEMAEYVGAAGGLVLIWDGRSKGSRDMLTKALNRNLTIHKELVPIKTIFEGLAEKWKHETRHFSNTNRKVVHQSYMDIVSMGVEVVPFIIDDLRSGPSDWYWALTSITGINPIPVSDNGITVKMADAWIKWFDEKSKNNSEK